MPEIFRLSPHVADLIAAGEVVERPASVVKELVENSIDAGATAITVEIQNGGMTFLRVTDNGCGIAPEDAETAFLRHATSKIREKEDLEKIGTLGFRGEALAATAAVSRIDLLTCRKDAPEGVHLHLEGGKVLANEPAGCPEGTTLIVRDLFYNTPARMKFMKSDTAESSAVLSAVRKQALAHTGISFRLLKDGEEVLHSPGDGNLEAAVYSVLGRQTALEMIPVRSSWEKIKVTGCIGKPTATRGTRGTQMFFVNGRFVLSKTLTAALEEAYRNRMMTGRYPMCVLYLEVPLSMVDVNVHPAKTEVKFLVERDVFDCVHYGVRAALDRDPGKPEFLLQSSASGGRQADGKQERAAGGPLPGERKGEREDAPADSRGTPAKHPAQKTGFYRTMTAEEYRTFAAALAGQQPVKPSDGAMSAVFGEKKDAPAVHEEVRLPQPDGEGNAKPAEAAPKRAECPPPEAGCPQPDGTGNARPADSVPGQAELPIPETAFRVIGETMNTYILVEQGEDLLLIDKHAAHERILFEKLLAQGTEVMSQCLIAPLACDLTPEEASVLTQNREMLLTLGYDLDDAGDGTVLLRRLPAGLDAADAAPMLAELAEKLSENKKETPQTVRETLLHSMACKAAVKGGMVSSDREREAIVSEVLSRNDLKYCPHGRPICVVLTRKQLEKQFKRIV